MKTATSTTMRASPLAGRILAVSGIFWYSVAVVGQGLFIYFIVSFYYRPTIAGHFAAWNRQDLITGFVVGDRTGNLVFAAHVLVAALITASGALQLVPQIRTHFIAFHRWNGRFFIAAAFLMGLEGLWLVWVRRTYLTLYGATSVSILGILILICAAQTLRYALGRRIDLHRRWALRTFLVANGVWFQRVGYMAWIILNQGPVGIGDRMDGPFDVILGFAEYVVPLSVLEIYLRTRDRGTSLAKTAFATGLAVLTVIMGVGIFGTVTIMWRKFL